MDPSIVRSIIKKFDEERHVATHQSPLVKRLVSKESKEVLSVFLDGVKMDGSFGSMERFGQRKWLKTNGDNRYDPKDPYHLDLKEVVVISK